jgi:hypothetical protein
MQDEYLSICFLKVSYGVDNAQVPKVFYNTLLPRYIENVKYQFRNNKTIWNALMETF